MLDSCVRSKNAWLLIVAFCVGCVDYVSCRLVKQKWKSLSRFFHAMMRCYRCDDLCLRPLSYKILPYVDHILKSRRIQISLSILRSGAATVLVWIRGRCVSRCVRSEKNKDTSLGTSSTGKANWKTVINQESKRENWGRADGSSFWERGQFRRPGCRPGKWGKCRFEPGKWMNCPVFPVFFFEVYW